METEKKIVRVACAVPNGVMIRRWKPGYDDGTGFKPTIPDGPAVQLNGTSAVAAGVGNTSPSGLDPGITEVDAEWWDAWLAQNGENPLVAMEHVWVLKDPEEAKAEPDPDPTF